MSTLEKNKRLIETLCKTVFQNHDFSKLDEIMRDDYIQHNPDTPQGKAGFKEFFQGAIFIKAHFCSTACKDSSGGTTPSGTCGSGPSARSGRTPRIR